MVTVSLAFCFMIFLRMISSVTVEQSIPNQEASPETYFKTTVPLSTFEGDGSTMYMSIPNLPSWLNYSLVDPVHVGGFPYIDGRTQVISKDGDYLYTASRMLKEDKLRFHVYSLSDPSQPTLTGSLDFEYDVYSYAIKVLGDVVFLTASNAGLFAVDVSDKENPSVIDSYIDSIFFSGLDISDDGNYLYCVGSGFLKIFDISGIDSPPFISRISTITLDGSGARGVKCVGNTTYVADGPSGLRIYNTTNRTSFDQEVVTVTGINAFGVDIYGSYAFVCDYDTGLKVIDLVSFTLVGTHAFTSCQRIAVSDDGTSAFLFKYQTLSIIDISTPESPSPFFEGTVDNVRALVHDSSLDYLYIADVYQPTTTGWCDVMVFDISDPSNPEKVSTEFTLGSVKTVESLYSQTDGLYSFIVDSKSVKIVEFSYENDDYSGTVISEIPINVYEVKISSDGNRLYGSDRDSLYVVDISTKASPSVVGSVEMNNDDTSITSFFVDESGTYAYVANRTRGFSIYDVSSDSDPTLVWRIAEENVGYNGVITEKDGLVYVVDDIHGLRIYDVSDLSQSDPILVGEVGAGDISATSFADICLSSSSDVLVVACDSNGNIFFDVSDPENPKFLELFDPYDGNGNARFLECSTFSEYAFVGDDEYLSVYVIQFRNLTDPVLDVLFTIEESPQNDVCGIDVKKNLIFSGMDTDGMKFWEFGDIVIEGMTPPAGECDTDIVIKAEDGSGEAYDSFRIVMGNNCDPVVEVDGVFTGRVDVLFFIFWTVVFLW